MFALCDEGKWSILRIDNTSKGNKPTVDKEHQGKYGKEIIKRFQGK